MGETNKYSKEQKNKLISQHAQIIEEQFIFFTDQHHTERVKQMRIFHFRLSSEQMMTKAREVSSAMARDADILEQYGVTAARMQDFAAAIAAADALADDVISRWYVSEAVAARDKKQEQIRARLEEMVLRVRLCYGAQTPFIGIMDCHNLAQKNASELLESCQNALAVLSENFAALSVFGLTQPMLDALAAARAELIVLADAVTDAQRERMEMTLRRADALNEIYETMVGFCTIGKLLWADVNPAKYEDYVIYHTKPKSAPAMPENNTKSDAGENM